MESSRTRYPWAQPAGTRTSLCLSPTRSKASHFLNVGLSLRRSTTTSQTWPQMHLTSFGCCITLWKWRARTTPLWLVV